MKLLKMTCMTFLSLIILPVRTARQRPVFVNMMMKENALIVAANVWTVNAKQIPLAVDVAASMLLAQNPTRGNPLLADVKVNASAIGIAVLLAVAPALSTVVAATKIVRTSASVIINVTAAVLKILFVNSLVRLLTE